VVGDPARRENLSVNPGSTTTPAQAATPATAEAARIASASRVADVPQEKADLMHAIYERITVAGPEIVGFRLTVAACRTDWRSRCQKRF
jgi:hypothetical protein